MYFTTMSLALPMVSTPWCTIIVFKRVGLTVTVRKKYGCSVLIPSADGTHIVSLLPSRADAHPVEASVTPEDSHATTGTYVCPTERSG